jgi:hypothetical protein
MLQVTFDTPVAVAKTEQDVLLLLQGMEILPLKVGEPVFDFVAEEQARVLSCTEVLVDEADDAVADAVAAFVATSAASTKEDATDADAKVLKPRTVKKPRRVKRTRVVLEVLEPVSLRYWFRVLRNYCEEDLAKKRFVHVVFSCHCDVV